MYGYLICENGSELSGTIAEGWKMNINYGAFRFWYNPLPKFEKDHLFFENESCIVLLDGVILNKDELLKTFRGG